MTCPKCDATIKAYMSKCPKCGLPLTYNDKVGTEDKLPVKTIALRALLVALGVLVTLSVITFIVMRIYYARTNERITKEYVKQVIETITLENGTQGHALTFFGKDGDCIYIEELGRSYMFSGGIARVEFEDSIWFENDPVNTDSATITFSPIYISSTGKKTRIPVFSVKVDVPEAPITITEPEKPYNTVITSQTGLSMKVVYGSQVIINGEDVSAQVDRSGNLALTLNIQPIGENNISIIVRTPNHREARRDLTFYREEMDINLEVASSVVYTSTQSIMTIKGRTEPGAWIVVESEYEKGSLVLDQSTGSFEFKARFRTYGKNLVSFKATMDGRRDSAISFYVNYLPAKAEYTRNAWTMDYAQLKMYYQQWNGRVFLCIGKIVNLYTENGTTYAIMNVGNDADVKLVALENQSNVGRFNVGSEYAVYADVAGRIFYDTNYVPYLIARYSRD